jgi:hypothetical protein
LSSPSSRHHDSGAPSRRQAAFRFESAQISSESPYRRWLDRGIARGSADNRDAAPVRGRAVAATTRAATLISGAAAHGVAAITVAA